MSNLNGKTDVTSTESKTTSTVGNFSPGSREAPVTSVFRKEAERSVEGRGLTKENAEQLLLDRAQSRETDGEPWVARLRGLLGVREAARKDRRMRFTNLLHHITEELLRDSFFFVIGCREESLGRQPMGCGQRATLPGK